MMKLDKNISSEYYTAEQEQAVIKLALNMANTGTLRSVLDNGQEIGYWYAPEVSKGKPTICAHGINKCKTVSLAAEKNDHLTDGEYEKFIEELQELTANEKEFADELFVILESSKDNKWSVSLDSHNKPRTYSVYESASKQMNRLANVEEKKEVPDVYAYKILKYKPLQSRFDKGIIVESFYALKTNDGQYIGQSLQPILGIENAVTFDSTNEGELSARALAEQLGVHCAYYETREIWVN